MTEGYTYFEHTADVGIEARGGSLAEAFANAGHGLVNILVDARTVRPTACRDVTLTSDDLDELLVAWLNELIFLFDSEGFLPVAFAFSTLNEEGLVARAWGETFDPGRHAARKGVKAATYHQVSVVRGAEVVVRAIVDV